MAFAEEAKKILAVVSAGMHGLEAIGTLANDLIANEPLAEPVLAAVRAIAAMVDSIQQGFDGKAAVQDVEDSIQAAHARIATNDQEIDASLK